MTDISPESVERLAIVADLFAKAMKAFQHHTKKHNEDVRDTLRAQSLRIVELEAALDAPNRHSYQVGVAVGRSTARNAALDEAAEQCLDQERDCSEWSSMTGKHPNVYEQIPVIVERILALKER